MTEWTYAWPLTSYYSAYVDPVKSLPHTLPNGTIENQTGLPFWIPLQRYLVDLNDYLDVISQLDLVEYTVNDPVLTDDDNNPIPLIKFYVENGKSSIWDGALGNGMIGLKYVTLGPLTAYRKRDDGLLGIESLTKELDTRLSTSEYMKNPEKFPPGIPTTNTEDANFSNLLDNVNNILAENAMDQEQELENDETN